MKLACSNIGLPSFAHEELFPALRDMGFEGIEVAPSKVWQDVSAVPPAMVERYRRAAEDCGLKIAGLHSLFFDQPGMNVFGPAEGRKDMLVFLTHLSRICRDLGGRTLVFGSPSARRRGSLPMEEADDIFADFLSQLAHAIAGHGTALVMEALGPSESDYMHTVAHARSLLLRVRRPEIQVHLDAKALHEADEMNLAALRHPSLGIAHVHVNEPGLGELTRQGGVPHHTFGALLKQMHYDGFATLEQRMTDPEHPLRPLARSAEIMRENYA